MQLDKTVFEKNSIDLLCLVPPLYPFNLAKHYHRARSGSLASFSCI